jgi:hypothetical protein
MMRAFWRAVALFAYRRWARPEGRRPVGIPGNRDPESQCDGYAPRMRDMGDWSCAGDGHYLCPSCAHFVRDDGDTPAWSIE